VRAWRGRLSFAPGAVVVLVCGAGGWLAFPLDDLWHQIFGQDVTVWSPTHLLMIAGGAFAGLGLWMLIRSGHRLGTPTKHLRGDELRAPASLLVGLTLFQAEFDFGVPQVQLLYQPVLIAIAAAFVLVPARMLLGRGGAALTVMSYLVVRLLTAAFVGPVAGEVAPDFALYAAEALVVELVALRWADDRLRMAVAAGVGVGTVGFAGEWAWSHAVMTDPWTESMLATALPLAVAAGLGASLLGARFAQGLQRARRHEGARAVPAGAVALGAAALLVALAVPLPRSGADGTRASIVPRLVDPAHAQVRVRLDPPGAARGSEWFQVISWHGGSHREVIALRKDGPRTYVSAKPVPVGGRWKSLLRLAHGSHLLALPVYLPSSPDSGREGAPLVPRTGNLVQERRFTQREALEAGRWAGRLGYALLVVVTLVWLWAMVWALRLGEAETPPAAAPSERPPAPAHAA
jgi:hypothetical protein